MIDINNLNEKDNNLIIYFFEKRKLFDDYIKKNNLKQFTCPGCGYPTLSERGEYEICGVCNWEDDNQDDDFVRQNLGGPNRISLLQNRINIGRIIDGEKILDSKKIDPLTTIKIIEEFEKKLKNIGKRMTGNESIQSPIWEEWKSVENAVQIALSEINKYKVHRLITIE